MFTYPYEDGNILVGIFIFYKGNYMVFIDGGPLPMPRRSPAEVRERRERQAESNRRKNILEDTQRCMECKHFFYGYPSSPYGTTNMIPWTKHSTLKDTVWDEYGGPNGSQYQKGYCRFNPEPTEKHTGDTCGQFSHDETKIYKMIQFYGECVHDFLHEVFPERDWYIEDFPPQGEPEVLEVTPTQTHMDEGLFEVE